MKSLYLLCEYGIPYGTVKNLNDKNITINNIAFDSECLTKLLGKKSKKKDDILSAIPLILNNPKEDSIFSLIDFGLSSVIANNLFFKKIEISDVLLMDEETAKNLYGINNSSYQKVIQSIKEYMNSKKDTPIQHGYPNYVLNYIKNTFYNDKFTKESLEIGLSLLKYDTQYLDEDINFLIDSGELKYKEGYYFVSLPYLMESLNNLKEDHKIILLEKLEGKTLEYIGQERGVTRERIRQVIAKSRAKIPVVFEDTYSDLFSEYNFDCNTFCEIFEVEKYVYYYLKEKYSIGEKDKSDLLDLDILNDVQKEKLRKKCNIIIYNHENMVVNKNNILEAILKSTSDQIEINQLLDLYNDFIDKYNLQNVQNYLSKEEARNVERVLSVSRKIICAYKRRYRYFDIDSLSTVDITNLGNLLIVDSGAYSTELFFNDNPLLMKELDIRDEYELHNILKKLFSDSEKFNFTRMPDVLIDCNNKLDFIEDKIKELSPIGIDDFCQFIYENYGHKIDTFKALLMTNFNIYIDNYVLKVESPEFTDEQREIIKNYLQGDIYSIKTLKKLLTDLFDVDDFRLINNINLSKMGYKVRGNYIMKSNIISLEDYLKNKVLSNDYYFIESEYKKIGSTFYSYLYKMIYDMILFKIDEDKYITTKKLNKLGIEKRDIIEFQNKTLEIISNNQYFNLSFIKRNMNFNNLKNEEFTDDFYETIVSIIPSIKTFTIDGNRMFIKSEVAPTRELFISSIIEEKRKITIKELKKYLIDKYNIDIIESIIRQYINKKRFYYHEGTDCVYINKEMYDNEVDQWDILQYIN